MKKILLGFLLCCMVFSFSACDNGQQTAKTEVGENEQKEHYEMIDVFEYVSVDVMGIAPYATASLRVSEDAGWFGTDAFVLDKSEEIKNGDIVTVTCNITQDVAEQAGYHIVTMDKQFYVQLLDQYVNNVAQLEGFVLQEIVDEEVQVICDDTENLEDRMLYRVSGKSNYLFQYNKEWVDSLQVQDIILCTPIDYQNENLEKNIIYIVLKANVANSNYSEQGYFFFRYDNGVISGDGRLHLNHENVQERYVCAAEYDELYNMLIVPLASDYYIGSADSSELTISLKKNAE